MSIFVRASKGETTPIGVPGATLGIFKSGVTDFAGLLTAVLDFVAVNAFVIMFLGFEFGNGFLPSFAPSFGATFLPGFFFGFPALVSSTFLSGSKNSFGCFIFAVLTNGVGL